jgi:hypothetical protein
MPVAFVVLLLAAVGAYAAIAAAFFGGPDGKRNPLFGIVVLVAVLAIGWGGYYSLGWLGVLTFYGAAIAGAAACVVSGAYLYMFVFQRRLSGSRARLARLSDDQLLSVMGNRSDPDFRFAAAELHTRRPSDGPEH